MERYCSNCRYYELNIDALPCSECSKQHAGKDHSHWAPDFDDITDPFERLGAILENQTYLLLEIGRLRDELNRLTETVKERNKE